MFSRRHFLQASAVSAGVRLAAIPESLHAEEPCTPLPPSITSLKSMKDQAHPKPAGKNRDDTGYEPGNQRVAKGVHRCSSNQEISR